MRKGTEARQRRQAAALKRITDRLEALRRLPYFDDEQMRLEGEARVLRQQLGISVASEEDL